MGLSQMQTVVIATVILLVIKSIFIHEFVRDTLSNTIWDDPVLKNYTTILGFNDNSTAATLPQNSTVAQVASVNGTSSTASPEKSFYRSTLPYEVFLYVLIVPLQQYWNLLLERLFPTRPRGGEALRQSEKVKAFDDEGDREDELVRRLVAQGKVRRPTMSLCNTALKWLLDLTVGTILFSTIFHTIDGIYKGQGVSKTLSGLKGEVAGSFLISFVGINPLATLVGFILLPAQYRLIFAEGAGLAASIFLAAFFRVVAPWGIKSNFVQDLLISMTEATAYSQAQEALDQSDAGALFAARQAARSAGEL